MDIRSISAGAALRVAAIVLGLLVALRFLWFAQAIFIVAFLGVLLGLAVARATDFLERLRIPRGLGSALVIVTTLGLLVALGAALAPSVKDQTRQLSKDLPRLLDSAETWLRQSPARSLIEQPSATPPSTSTEPPSEPAKEPQNKPGAEPEQKKPGGLRDRLGREAQGSIQFFFPVVTSLFGAIGGFVLVIFIAMYVGAEPGMYRAGLLHLVPHRQRERADEVLRTLAVTLRQWLIARLIAMVVIGTLTGVGLMLLKVEGAAALGVLAGVLEFVPFFGPVASAVPAVGIALLDSPQKGLSVLIFYFVMQQLEGNVVTPLLLEKRLNIPPVLTVVTVAALGVVFGVGGMLVAEPLLATILVTTKMLYVNDVVGDDVQVGKEDGDA